MGGYERRYPDPQTISPENERQTMQDQTLIEKIRSLRPERVAEVEDFVDFLRQRDEDRRLAQAAAKLS